uniref:Anoctamin n=2 Tax=Schistocephalus solidus TaxID=70667 RepID=A0A0V0J2G9_SCHSO
MPINETNAWFRSCCFEDGERTIDYVVVWKTGEKTKLTDRLEQARSTFKENLLAQAIELEEDIEETSNGRIHYLKVHVPWEVLCSYAEELKLRVPLGVQKTETRASFYERCALFKPFQHNAPNEPPRLITCQFRLANLTTYLGRTAKNDLFTTTQRHQVAYHILASTCYGDFEMGQIGIDRMIEESIYETAYPVNEGPYESTAAERKNPAALSRRQVLYHHWARWSCWTKFQPLDHIREYYGESIALYFAWLGCYTQWLLPAGVMGLACFLYGLFTVRSFVPGREVCNHRNPIRMCPFCDENLGCDYWYLHNLCVFRQVSYLFDHEGTVFFSVFMVTWAVLFLEAWKRKCAKLSHRWDVFDYEREEETIRPQYARLCTECRPNVVTQKVEPYFPRSIQRTRILIGVITSLLLLSLVIVFMIAVIIYRCLVTIPLFRHPALRSQASIFANMTGACINLVLIMILGRLYQTLAYKMTQWEMHETQSAFDKYLTIKVFLFEFVNYYASIFYIAFFKGRFVGHPGAFATFLGLRNEACSTGGCLVELAQDLLVFMVGKQIVNNCQEILFPIVASWFHRKKSGLVMAKSSDAESGNLVQKQYMDDYRLFKNAGLFEEYIEMVIQFGFITLFVAAFPLAPLFALCNNWLEIRIDAQKLVCATRRPLAQRARSIGIWFSLTEVIVGISIITNVRHRLSACLSKEGTPNKKKRETPVFNCFSVVFWLFVVVVVVGVGRTDEDDKTGTTNNNGEDGNSDGN